MQLIGEKYALNFIRDYRKCWHCFPFRNRHCKHTSMF